MRRLPSAALIIAAAMVILALSAVSCDASGPGLEYKAISETEAEVRCAGNGTVNADIPSTVILDGKTYTVTAVAERGFSECSTIKSVKFPDSLKIIRGGAFEECTSLKEADIPEGTVALEQWAFIGCSGLEKVHIPKTLTEIGDAAFKGCTNPNLRFTADPDNPVFAAGIGGQLVNKDRNMLVCGLNGTAAKIPNNIIIISEWAFYGCRLIESVDIPNGVRVIGYSAFEECSALKSVKIPKSVTVVGEYTFFGCTNPGLTFTVDGGNTEYRTDGASLYHNNTGSLMFTRNTEEPSIAEGTRSIGTSAFN